MPRYGLALGMSGSWKEPVGMNLIPAAKAVADRSLIPELENLNMSAFSSGVRVMHG